MKALSSVQISLLILITLFSMTACNVPEQTLADGVKHPSPKDFSVMIHGKQVSLYTLVNSNGLRADITNYGGRIVSLLVPDKDGVYDDIVTGYHSIREYLDNNEMYFGTLVGRYGNRIANAQFTIDGELYSLIANNGPNSLHGGPGGFHRVVWDAELINGQTLKLTYLSPDMEEGFPGNLEVTVLYVLNDDNELSISYTATTDKATHVNLTNHAYYNLGGEGDRSIGDHELLVQANYFVPVNEYLIPTGILAPVVNTPFDFLQFRRIGERIDSNHEQMKIGGGYDHCYVLRKTPGVKEPELAVTVYEPSTGRVMEILTTEPGIQFYSGNFMTGAYTGKRGELYNYRTAFCLETQHFPDSPNQPQFPSTLLQPGEIYQTTTVHRFSVKND